MEDMYRRFSLDRHEDGYVLRLAVHQFRLIKYVVGDLHHSIYPSEMIFFLAGFDTGNLLNVLDSVDLTTRSTERINLILSREELRAMYGALSYTYLSCSSEEVFHIRSGFFSENVKALALSIVKKLYEMEDPVDEP